MTKDNNYSAEPVWDENDDLAEIDFRQNVVHVRKTISMDMKGRGFLGDGTKTYAGVRDIPISRTLRPVLEDALKKMKPNKENLLR